MNDSELDSILKRARMPQQPSEFWEEFPQQVVRQLNRQRMEDFRPERNWFPRLAWGLATAACILIAFAIGHWRGRTEKEMIPANDTLASAELVRETLAMFPNQVRAIVEDAHGLNLILSKNKDVPASTPIYVRICDGTQCSSLVTFSGQEIQIAGQKITVLSDASGGIILVGNKFVWSSASRIYANRNLKIEARPL